MAGADPALVLVVALAEDGVVLAARAVEALLHQVRAVRQRTLARKVAATSHKRGDRVAITTIVVIGKVHWFGKLWKLPRLMRPYFQSEMMVEQIYAE